MQFALPQQKLISGQIKLLVSIVVLFITIHYSFPWSWLNTFPIQAGDEVTSRMTTFYSGTDYPGGSPATTALVPPSSGVTIFIDIMNTTTTPNALENMVLSDDISAFSGSLTCSYMVTTSSANHLLLDFDGSGSICTINSSNGYQFEGASFPTSLAAGDGIFFRLTGLTVDNDSILHEVYVNGTFAGQSYGPARDHQYILVGTRAITGYAFHDLDNNRLNDNLDYQYVGLVATLRSHPTGTAIATMTTDTYGYYYFTEETYPDLTLGNNFRVHIAPDVSQSLTTGNNPQIITSLTNGITNLTDIGYYTLLTSQLGDRIWLDSNYNGIQDGDELNGIANIDLDLYQVRSSGDVLLASTSTDSDGDYNFNFQPNLNCRGELTTFGDSDADVYDVRSCTVISGATYYISFRTDGFCVADNTAIRLLSASGDTLYEAGCGSRAPDIDHTLADNTVYSVGPFSEDTNGIATLSAIESYGDVSFYDVHWTYTGNIIIKNYLVISNVPPEYSFTLGNQGGDESLDSDVSIGTQTDTATVTIGESVLDLDIGFLDTSTLVPDLVITKSVDDEEPTIDTQVTYTITVTNNGIGTASGVTVLDTLPAGTSWVSDTGAGAYDPELGEWLVGDLLANESTSLDITVTVTGTEAIVNTATGSTLSTEPDTTNNSDSATLTPQDPISSGTGTLLFHLFTDTNGNGTQDTGEPDGASDTIITIGHSLGDQDVVTDEFGDIDTDMTVSSDPYTITLSPPSGSSITGGDNPITGLIINVGEITDAGIRGVYIEPVEDDSESSGGSGGGSARVTWGNIGRGNNRSSGNWLSSDGRINSSTITIDSSTVESSDLATSISCLAINGAPPLSFPDAENTEYAATIHFLTTIIEPLNNERLIKGYENGEFGTYMSLTRYELTKIALMGNCINHSGQYQANTVFSDVPTNDSEMSLIIGTAQHLGIVDGIDGKFYPNNPVTFGEMVKILLGSNRQLKATLLAARSTEPLAGVTENGFAPFAQYAYQYNMVTLENGIFPQNKVVLRNQMATTLATYIRQLKSFAD
ncbi:MAG: DUF11 domain-containing protein [Candidatus Abawacabacteria bacterium]|nr:DUF11 domain-containing protein [Candidatus Abawacabacteria bacterium]